MRHDYRSRYGWSFLAGLCTCVATATAQANAGPALAKLNQVVTAGQVINSVVFQGTANWYSGSLEDSGPVTLTASSSGASQMQISLSSQGVRTEAQSGQGSSQSCTWTGANGISHAVTLGNCWKPFVFFLPALSLQTGRTAASLGVADMGTGTLNATSYRHLQSQLVFSDTPTGITTDVMQSSTTDLWLDPVSVLPAALTYKIQPDSGSSTPISIEVRYSNYTLVQGIQIPFRIQRYINGSLQLDITVGNAQIN